MREPGQPSLDQLRVFVAVIDAGGFAHAARQLHRTQSVISYTIANLEEQLNVVLLDRDDVYDWQPYFYSDQYDVAMEYLGRGGRDDELVVRGSLDDDHFSAYWLAGDTVTAAMQVNEPRLAGPLRKIVGQVVDRGRLADPGVPLEEHLAD